MTHQIKFRVRSEKTKEIIGYEEVKDGNWHCEYTGTQKTVNRYNYGVFTKQKYIREQFTGLLDRNNKEIFEGDVIIWITSRGKTKYRVFYGFGKWLVEDEAGKTSPLNTSSSLEESKNVEVVSDIYKDEHDNSI